jgi:hypothetical protein
MNTNATRLLANFRKMGRTRQAASFFGLPMVVSPSARMVTAFAAAGLTQPKANIFNIR